VELLSREESAEEASREAVVVVVTSADVGRPARLSIYTCTQQYKSAFKSALITIIEEFTALYSVKTHTRSICATRECR
jgi:hypothetical protein